MLILEIVVHVTESLDPDGSSRIYVLLGKLLNHLTGVRIVFPDSIVIYIELLPEVLLIECALPKVPV